jgi:hypothetical protein
MRHNTSSDLLFQLPPSVTLIHADCKVFDFNKLIFYLPEGPSKYLKQIYIYVYIYIYIYVYIYIYHHHQ